MMPVLARDARVVTPAFSASFDFGFDCALDVVGLAADTAGSGARAGVISFAFAGRSVEGTSCNAAGVDGAKVLTLEIEKDDDGRMHAAEVSCAMSAATKGKAVSSWQMHCTAR